MSSELQDVWFWFLVIFHEKDCEGEGKLYLIPDKPYVLILQYLGGKWL